MIRYRPEVDGLRAIAVVAVLIYHAGFVVSGHSLLTGGYLGVDIFFVISGYLITSILVRDLDSGQYSIIRFYERRARRILPALVFILAACMPAAWFLLMPGQLEEFGESLAATFLFASNIYFMFGESYAAEASDFKPLLHTWSLSLEEQFYVLFPILLALCWKIRKQAVAPLMLLTAGVSLAVAQWSSAHHPDAGFYLLHTRAWELLAGSILAVHESRSPPSSRPWHGPVAGLGLVAVLVSICVLNEQTAHPGLATLPTVAGTVALIHCARGDNWITRLLASRAMVGIGLVSYSLYLWHQPLLAFARIHHVYALDNWQKAAILALSLVLSWLTWKFVETPFRNRKGVSTPTIWKLSAASTLVMILVGIALHVQRGAPSRIPDSILEARHGNTDPWLLLSQDDWTCYDREAEVSCRFGNPGATERWTLLGDSHLAAFSLPLLERIEQRGAQLLMLTRGACPYAPYLEMRIEGRPDVCTYREGMQRRDIMLASPPSIVIVGGRMPLYLSGSGFDNGEGGVEHSPAYRMHFGSAGTDQPLPSTSIESQIVMGFRELLDAGHRLVLVYPVPEMGVNVPAAIYHGRHGDSSTLLSISYQRFLERSRDTYALYDSLGEHERLIRVKPEQILCNTMLPDRCVAHHAGVIFYSDDDHLSIAGGRLLAEQIVQAVDSRWGTQ